MYNFKTRNLSLTYTQNFDYSTNKIAIAQNSTNLKNDIMSFYGISTYSSQNIRVFVDKDLYTNWSIELEGNTYDLQVFTNFSIFYFYYKSSIHQMIIVGRVIQLRYINKLYYLLILILILFNDNVTSVSGKNIVLKKYSDDSVLETIDAGTVTVVNDLVTINLNNPLPSGTQVYLDIEEEAFKYNGYYFKGIFEKEMYNFTTQ